MMQPVKRFIESIEPQEEEIGQIHRPRYFLAEGANYFGSHPNNSIVFPGDKTALFAGIFFVKDDSVLLKVARSVRITHQRKAVNDLVIFSNENSVVLEYQDLKFRVIREGGKLEVSFLTLAS